MKDNYVMVVGDPEKFVENCNKDYNELLDIEPVPVEELASKLAGRTLHVIGKFKSIESFLSGFVEQPALYTEFVIGDFFDICPSEEREYCVGIVVKSVLYLVNLKKDVSPYVAVAKFLGFPRDFSPTSVDLMNAVGEVEPFSEGDTLLLNKRVFDLSILSWYRVLPNGYKEMSVDRKKTLFKNSDQAIFFSNPDCRHHSSDRFKIYVRKEKISPTVVS